MGNVTDYTGQPITDYDGLPLTDYMLGNVINSLTQLEDLFQGLTCSILGIDSATYPAAVRISWPPGGSPAWQRTEDVCFIQVTQIGGNYARFSERKNSTYVPAYLDQATIHTRIHSVMWTFYGPNGYDRAQQVRDEIYNQLNHDILARAHVFILPDDYPLRRIPENFQGQWWERTDITMQFNELTVRHLAVPYVQSVEIPIFDETASGDESPNVTASVSHIIEE